MADEQDITESGDPGPGDDGYSKTKDGGYPFDSNLNDLPDPTEDTDVPLEEVDKVQSDLESAASDTESDESPEFAAPEGGDPEPDTEQTDGDSSEDTQPEEEDYSKDVQPFEESEEDQEGDIGGSEVSSSEIKEAAPPPTHEEMSDITDQLKGDFGEKVEAFQEAGGDGGGKDYQSSFAGDYGSEGGEGGGGIEDYADANERHAEQQDAMLTEHIRRLDMMTANLENERL